MAYFGSNRKHAKAGDKYGVLHMWVNGNNVTNEAHKHLKSCRGSQSLGRKLVIVCEEGYESQNSLRIDQMVRVSSRQFHFNPYLTSKVGCHDLSPSYSFNCKTQKDKHHYTSTPCVKPPHTALSPLTLRRDQCVRPKALFR